MLFFNSLGFQKNSLFLLYLAPLHRNKKFINNAYKIPNKDDENLSNKQKFFISCTKSRIESNRCFYGCFYLGPFDPGQSLTVANTLRRTLLSELKGIAITSVEIEGALHEYSNLPGVRDSVLDILLNLKEIVLRKKRYFKIFKTQVGYLRAKGPCVIKASDLQLPPFIQCVDPNQYIATLCDDGILNMKFYINEGKNYHMQSSKPIIKGFLENQITQNMPIYNSSTSNTNKLLKTKKQEVFTHFKGSKKKNLLSGLFAKNLLLIDAVFMPVLKVNYIIESHELANDLLDSSYLQSSISYNVGSQDNEIGVKESISLYEPEKSLKITTTNSHNIVWGILKQQDILKTPLSVKGLYSVKEKTNFLNISKNSTNISNFTSLKSYVPGKVANKNKLFNSSIFSTKQKRTFLRKNSIIDPWSIHKPLTLERKKIQSAIKTQDSQNLNSSIFKAFYNFPKVNSHERSNKKNNPKAFSNKENAKTQKLLDSINIKTIAKKNFLTESNKKENSFVIENIKTTQEKIDLKQNIVLEIWTNGSIHPRQALYQALKDILSVFCRLKKVKYLGFLYKSEKNYKIYFKSVTKKSLLRLPKKKK